MAASGISTVSERLACTMKKSRAMGGPDHGTRQAMQVLASQAFCQRLLIDSRNLLRPSVLAIVRQGAEQPSQTLLAGVQEMIYQIFVKA
jgi:hypothetical protein